MRKFLKLKQRDPRLPTPGLEPSKAILTIVSSLGDGVVGVPGLKTAAQIVIKIIEVAQRVEKNAADCLIVAERAKQLMDDLIESLGGQQDADLDPHLRRDLERFNHDLRGILRILEGISKPKVATRVWKHHEHSEEITQCKETLEHSFKRFLVYNILALRCHMGDPSQVQSRNLDRSHWTENFMHSSAPPAAPEHFYGRESFIAQAISVLGRISAARIPILGAGGIGKTATALTILHHELMKQKFRDDRYFVSCEGAVTPSILLQRVMQVLGLHHQEGDVLSILRAKLVSLGQLLLVLDNFETPWMESGAQAHVEDILSRIACLEEVSLIITMRGSTPPSGLQWTQLENFPVLQPLHADAARALFLAVNPMMLDPESVKNLTQLLQEMDYVPLAIRLVAQISKGQSSQHMLRRWLEKRTAILQIEESGSHRLSSVDVSIMLSITSMPMRRSPEALDLLSVLSYLPEGLVQWEENLDSCTKGFGDAGSAVALLIRIALAYVDDVGTLKMLSPIRHHIISRHPPKTSHLQQLEIHFIGKIQRHAMETYGPDLVHSKDILMADNGNITAVFKNAFETHPSHTLANAAYKMARFLSMVQPSVELVDMLLGNQYMMKQPGLKGSCHLCKARILHQLSQYEEAKVEVTKAQSTLDESLRAASWLRPLGQKVFKQIGNQAGSAACLQILSRIDYMQNKYSEAQEKLWEAQKIFAQIGDQSGSAYCLRTLGDILRLQDLYPEAQEKLEGAQTIFKQIGNQSGSAHCLQSLGYIGYMQGKCSEAQEKLWEAQKIFVQIGDQSGSAYCLCTLGDILHIQNKLPEAQEKLEEAKDILKQIGQQSGFAECLRLLYYILHMQGKYPEAQEKLWEARKIFVQIGNQSGSAYCLYTLGDVLHMQNKHPEAQEKLEEAQDIFKQIGQQSGFAECLRLLGNILHMQGKHPEAQEKLEQALKIFNQIGNLVGASQCLQLLESFTSYSILESTSVE